MENMLRKVNGAGSMNAKMSRSAKTDLSDVKTGQSTLPIMPR